MKFRAAVPGNLTDRCFVLLIVFLLMHLLPYPIVSDVYTYDNNFESEHCKTMTSTKMNYTGSRAGTDLGFNTKFNLSTLSSNHAQNSILWSFAAGLRGRLSTDIIVADLDGDSADDSVVYGTTLGINILSLNTGQLINEYRTKSLVTGVALLADVNNNGFRDIGFSTIATREDNIIVIDSQTTTKLWGFKPTTNVYTENLGWQQLGTKTWDIERISSLNNNYLLASSWKFIFKFSAESGDFVWKFEANDDIWNIDVVSDLTGDGEDDLLAGTQDGYFYLINGLSGTQCWAKKLTESYTRKLQMGPAAIDYTIDRSVWGSSKIEDLDHDNVNDIIVCAEDGYVYALSGATGANLWKYKCILLSKPNQETTFGSPNFFNLRTQIVDDFDEDGSDDVLVISRDERGNNEIFILSSGLSQNHVRAGGIDRSSSKSRNSNSEKKDENTDAEEWRRIHLIDISSQGRNDYKELVTVDDISNDGHDEILLLNENSLIAYDTGFSNATKTYMDNAIFGFDFQGIRFKHVGDITGDGESEVLMTLGLYGIILIDLTTGMILWDFLNTGTLNVNRYTDLTGDGIDELLIEQTFEDNDEEFKPEWEKEKIIRGLYLVDTSSGELLWNYSVPLNKVSSDGFVDYKITSDMTSDGLPDIIGYSLGNNGKYSGSGSSATKIMLLNGNSGDIEWSRLPNGIDMFDNAPLDGNDEKTGIDDTRIHSISIVDDLNNDDINDIIIGSEESHLYVLNGCNGTLLWEVTNNWEDGGDQSQIWFDCHVDGKTHPGIDKDELSYTWESDLDGVISDESSFNGLLSSGSHEITLMVEDKAGNWGMDKNEVHIIPNNQPVFKIQDSNQCRYFSNEQTNLWIESRNFDGGNADITWFSDRDGELGSGSNLNAYISPGKHTITAEITDYDNGYPRIGSSELELNIFTPREFYSDFIVEDHDWYGIPANKDTTFRAEFDYEGDRNRLEYIWYKDGFQVATIDTLHETFSPGSHTVSLKITDPGLGYSDSRTKYIYVLEENAPVLGLRITDSFNEWSMEDENHNFYYTIPSIPYDNTIRLDSWVSDDSKQSSNINYNYTIELGDGTVVYDSYCEHNYSIAGTHQITVTVIDDFGNSASRSVRVKVLPNGYPVPRWQELEQNQGQSWAWINSQLNFDASGSYDPDGENITFLWDFGDGISDNSATTTHSYSKSGEYTVKLTVTDDQARSSSIDYVFKILSVGEPMAQINYWINDESKWQEELDRAIKITSKDQVRMDASVKNQIHGLEYQYFWYFDDVLQSTGKSYSPTFQEGSDEDNGDHIVELKIQDGVGNEDQIKYKFYIRPSSGLHVNINEPTDNDVNVGIQGDNPIKIKNIDWLPWTCSAMILDTDYSGTNILIVGDGRLTATRLDSDGISSDYTWRYPDETSESWVDENQVKIGNDRNGDGIKDITVWVGSHDGGQYETISGASGEELPNTYAFMKDPWQNNEHYVYTDYFSQYDIYLEDFNNNGVNDSVLYSALHDDNKLTLSALDGQTGTKLWNEPQLFKDLEDIWRYQQYSPVTIIEDQNEDGIKDIIVGSTRTDSSGADLRIYDGKTGTKLKTVVYEDQELHEDWVKTVPVMKLSAIDDVTGDGRADAIVHREAGTAKENEREKTILEIIDIAGEKSIRSFEIQNTDILNNGDMTGNGIADVILIIDGILYCLNGGFSVNILSPEPNTISGDILKLKWDKPDLECEVVVDGISYGYFTNGETHLTLSAGRHIVQVQVRDEFGGVVSDSVVVEVPENIWMNYLNYFVLALVFIYISVRTAVPIIRRKKRKKEILAEIQLIAKKKAEAVRKRKVPVVVRSGKKPAVQTMIVSNMVTNTRTITPKRQIYVDNSQPRVQPTNSAQLNNQNGQINMDTSQKGTGTLLGPRSDPVSRKVPDLRQDQLKYHIPMLENGTTTEPEFEPETDLEPGSEVEPYTSENIAEFEERIELYRAALETAYSDGVITDDENKMLKWIRERHGITMDEHRILVTQFFDIEDDLDFMLEE